jgi:hypothetical protein
MRIIAEQKDYYDCIQAEGQDRTLVYLRTPEVVEIEWFRFPFPNVTGQVATGRMIVDITTHIVGFCGKIYPALELAFRDTDAKPVFCLNRAEVDSAMKELLSPARLAIYQGKDRSFPRWQRYGLMPTRSRYDHFFEECSQKQNDYGRYFQEKRCPVFVATVKSTSSARIVYNSLLRPYEFYRVFEPYTAFQEIAMFLANMANPEKPMPVIPDELKAESKGFDRWSFRRPPGG